MYSAPLATLLFFLSPLLSPVAAQDASVAEPPATPAAVAEDADDADADTPVDAAEPAGAAAEETATDDAVEPAAAGDTTLPEPDFSVTQVGDVEVKEIDNGPNAFLIFLIVAALLILPFVIGSFVAKRLKVREHGTRLGVLLLALVLAVFPFLSEWLAGNSWRDAIRLGIDLAGGTNMKFMVDRDELAKSDKQVTPEIMDRMVGAIGRRIDPAGTQELTVRRVADDQIEVIVPGADAERVKEIKSAITRLGSLEFAILADRNQRLHTRVIKQAENEPGTEVRNSDGAVTGLWRTVGTRGDGTEVDFVPNPTSVFRRANRDGQDVVEYLLVVDPNPEKRITGRLLDRAFEDTNQSGEQVVGFNFNTKGGSLFQTLTTRYKPDPATRTESRLAVLLDNQIQSAPSINEPIGARGQISGQYDQKELDSLINVLNAGALEVPLLTEPVFESSVSPLLGLDVQEKGKLAIGLATLAVFIFMAVYYRAAGIIADICLFINIVLVLGVMALIDATFTLPGLAGLVLTIGMAVDANVLIFERIREERAKGASLRMAINNGFSRAFTTIVDANVTTLITAVVLYIIGTDTIKGFAVTLFIGIVMSMFTALYIGRMFFDIAERKRWIKDLSMASIVGKTEISFLSYRKLAAIVSAVLIGIGLTAFVLRGARNYGIDFRGGSMVTFRATGDDLTQDKASELLRPLFEEEPSVETLSIVDPETGESSELLRVRTPNKDLADVESKVASAFEDAGFSLPRQSVTFGAVEAIPDAAPEAGVAPDAFAGGREFGVQLDRAKTTVALKDELRSALETVNADYGDGQTYFTVEPDAAAVAAADTSAPADTVAVDRFTVRTTEAVSESDVAALQTALTDSYAASPDFEEVNRFDSSVAGEARLLAVTAMLVSLVAIVGYIWFRFQKVTFGLAAVAALIHDVLVVLGLVAIGAWLSNTPLRSILGLEDFKITLAMIAAFLTIVGYSLNDTIVVFDRIREVRGKNPNLSKDMIDTSLNQTLARTLLTSLTTFLVVLILYVLGGEGIHGFAYCLLMGVIVGTYSSIYVASPVLLYLTNGSDRKTAEAGEQAVATV